MSPDTSLSAGWHDTGEEPVPVRITESSGKQTMARPISAPALHQSPPRVGAPAAGVNPRSMQAAAILGIGIVLLGVAFYFGIDSLKGSLTDTAGNVTTVTITADGHFSPASVSLAAGSILTIENKNKDPQVLKVKSGTQLFPVQVLFTTPYSFTVPSDAAGTYTYFSETLSDSETLTITVSASIESAAASGETAASEAQSSVASDQIPLPFGDAAVHPTPAAEPPTSSISAAAAISTDHSTDTALIDLAAYLADTEASLGQNQLPTNPYTVAAAKNGKSRSTRIAANAKAKLHSGAPLREYKPRAVTQTGPEVWLLILPAMALMFGAYRKMSRA